VSELLQPMVLHALARPPRTAPTRQPGWRSSAPPRLELARDWLTSGSVLLTGAADADLGTALELVVQGLPDRVLACRPVWSDQRRPLCGLVRLLSTVSESELERVPDELARVLADGAAESARPLQSTMVLGEAMLGLLTGLARRDRVLLMVSDVQWLDRHTVAVLRYVAGHADASTGGIRMLATERLAGGSPPRGLPLCPEPLMLLQIA
jgi:hypothetical protein